MISLPVDIRNICVLLAPGFSGLTALATYLFTREMSGDGAGLLAAAFIGIAPGEPWRFDLLTKGIFRDRLLDRMIMRQLRFSF